MSYNKACKPQIRSRPYFAGHCTYKQDETGFPLLIDHKGGREKGEDEGKGLVSMPSLAGAEPSSASSLTALQSGKCFPQAPTAAQMGVLGSSSKGGLNGQPSVLAWSLEELCPLT